MDIAHLRETSLSSFNIINFFFYFEVPEKIFKFASLSQMSDVDPVINCLHILFHRSMRSWLFMNHNFGQVISCVSCCFVTSRMTVVSHTQTYLTQ